MKFDYVVGNPPYQINVGKKKENYGVPVFQDFVESAKSLDPSAITMIVPSRWFTGGRGLDEFRRAMLQDHRIKNIVDFPNSRDCFNGVDIAGGVNYFVWKKDYDGPCTFNSFHDQTLTSSIRWLDEYEIFPRFNEALSIIEKVRSKKEKSLTTEISTQTPFGFITTFRGESKPFQDSVKLISSKEDSYVSRDQVSRNQEIIDKYKVVFSKATSEHAGIPSKDGKYKVLSTIKELNPNEVCTQSYLVAGSFDSKEESKNLVGYMKTKFFRFLLKQALTSQDISRDKFIFVPIQDFTENWTDEKLYKKYGLTQEEIGYIDSIIKEME